MKLFRTLRKLCNSRPPQTWRHVYAAILTLLLLFLAAVFAIDYLKGTLP